jgi:hypothetical protein
MTTNLPPAISRQSRPAPDGSLGQAYANALSSFASSSVSTGSTPEETEIPEVSADIISASIMKFLVGVADDEGGNAARYFPAVLVERMAHRIAADINAFLAS